MYNAPGITLTLFVLREINTGQEVRKEAKETLLDSRKQNLTRKRKEITRHKALDTNKTLHKKVYARRDNEGPWR